MSPDLSYSKHKILVCFKHCKLLKQPLKTTAPPKLSCPLKKATISNRIHTSSNHEFLRGTEAGSFEATYDEDSHPAKPPQAFRTRGDPKQGFNGTEIRRENPVVLVVEIYHYLQGFRHPRWCRISEPSTVWIYECARNCRFCSFRTSLKSL